MLRFVTQVELAEGQRQGGLEAQHARGGQVEGLLLGLLVVGGMVSGDGVDRAVEQAGPHGFAVG